MTPGLRITSSHLGILPPSSPPLRTKCLALGAEDLKRSIEALEASAPAALAPPPPPSSLGGGAGAGATEGGARGRSNLHLMQGTAGGAAGPPASPPAGDFYWGPSFKTASWALHCTVISSSGGDSAPSPYYRHCSCPLPVISSSGGDSASSTIDASCSAAGGGASSSGALLDGKTLASQLQV
jgi:hypothetical protein